jgi:hypothetical protein
MPLPANEFAERLKVLVDQHYAANADRPLLLSQLGTLLEKQDLWPEQRNNRSLKQLIEQMPELGLHILRDPKSPAFITVTPTQLLPKVQETIAKRSMSETPQVRLEEIAWPILLAFCIETPQGTPVYVSRTRPFRFIKAIPVDQPSNWILVDEECRRPGLRLDKLNALRAEDRLALATSIQNWCLKHDLRVEQFFPHDQDGASESTSPNALDRLLAAQTPDVARALVIPADIAQALARMK